MVEIRASEYRDPDDVIVASGQLLARRVVSLLRTEARVVVALDMRGLSSSYFNIFLRLITDELGPDAPARVDFAFASPLQRDVYARSLDALRATPSGHR